MPTSVMVCVYVVLLLVVSIAGDLWLRNDTSHEHQFFLNVSSVSKCQCSLICHQFHSCSQFGFMAEFCYCLGSSSHSVNMIHLDYYYERDIPYSPQANQELIAALVNKNYIIYNGTDFGIKKKNTPLKWDEAEADCVKDKGHLYRINSLFKREILERYLSDITFSSGEDFHVGLKKINGTWMWFDGGTDVFYLRPEGQNENCSRYFDKNITSTMCANTNEYLCEVSISV